MDSYSFLLLLPRSRLTFRWGIGLLLGLDRSRPPGKQEGRDDWTACPYVSIIDSLSICKYPPPHLVGRKVEMIDSLPHFLKDLLHIYWIRRVRYCCVYVYACVCVCARARACVFSLGCTFCLVYCVLRLV